MATILVVDDDALIRHAVTAILDTEGYTTATAVDGADALRKLAAQQHALVLLDLNMPGVTGWQVHAQLQREQPALPVVFMTAARDAAAEAARCGASGCLGKPFELMDLLGLVERFVPAPA